MLKLLETGPLNSFFSAIMFTLIFENYKCLLLTPNLMFHFFEVFPNIYIQHHLKCKKQTLMLLRLQFKPIPLFSCFSLKKAGVYVQLQNILVKVETFCPNFDHNRIYVYFAIQQTIFKIFKRNFENTLIRPTIQHIYVHKDNENYQKMILIFLDLGSISPTFFTYVFCTSEAKRNQKKDEKRTQKNVVEIDPQRNLSLRFL